MEFETLFNGSVVQPSIRKMNIHDVVTDCLSLMQHTSHGGSSVAFQLHIDPLLPESLESDPDMVRDIVFAILSNAQKFTGKGTITLKIEHVDGIMEIEVSDTGVHGHQRQGHTSHVHTTRLSPRPCA